MKFLEDAVKLIEERIGGLIQRSSVYETEPWGKIDQSMFLNMVICIETDLSAKMVLDKILEIEKELGRIRIKKWDERKIDIDILFYDDQEIIESELTVPHPYLHERMFVMQPLNEIAPDFIHPVFNCSMSELFNKCTDKTKVIKTGF
jgi:2-amino-4-hydroxy-6-hydroxymethyldihydropteridine diphosphokinase